MRKKRTLGFDNEPDPDYSPVAVESRCAQRYAVVVLNGVPRDCENPQGWPEVGLDAIEKRSWTRLVLHDLAGCGGMGQPACFLDEAKARGAELVLDSSPDGVPIRDGEPLDPLEARVCGDEPEKPHPIAAAAAERLG